MIKKEEFFLPSSDGVSKIFCVHFRCDKPARAVLQLSHGMAEHIMRYEAFARVVAENQIAVIGHDHLGHGRTAKNGQYGYFAQDKGDVCVIKDMHRVFIRARNLYPDLPHFFLGHSMGSFFLRKYMAIYGRELDGVLLLGTGDKSRFLTGVGAILADVIVWLKGPFYQSRFLYRLTTGGYGEYEWLSRDVELIKSSIMTPECRFHFTSKGYEDFFHLLSSLKKRWYLKAIPKTLPVYLLAGMEDVVGDKGRGVVRVCDSLIRSGCCDVSLKLYPEYRHEILNEIGKEQVYHDVISWIFSHIKEGE